MDGNGRWARQRGLPRHAGHRAGVKSVRATVERAGQLGIKHLTLFAFSSENWRRPAEEVSKLMGLFVEALQREVAELHRNKVKLQFIGDRHQLSDGLVRKIEAAEALTETNEGLNVIIAVAYGGRWDIVQAARRIADKVVSGRLRTADIDDRVLAGELQLAGIPDPDLLIRTGGERRISNFLLWNLAYAELWFCDSLWPDFREPDLDTAIDYFAERQRRYGRTGEQLEAVKC
jgi:undecaprenyl diphosphate synthase